MQIRGFANILGSICEPAVTNLSLALLAALHKFIQSL